MANVGLITLSILSLGALSAPDLSLSDRLMANLIDTHTDKQLYQQADNPWPGGKYQLDVFKNGKPIVTSGPEVIHIKVPLKIVIAGNAASGLLKFNLVCKTSFTTVGEVEFSPAVEGSLSPLRSQITLPIPAVAADCDGMQLPVDTYLTAFVAQNKRKWEQDIDSKVNAQLSAKQAAAE